MKRLLQTVLMVVCLSSIFTGCNAAPQSDAGGQSTTGADTAMASNTTAPLDTTKLPKGQQIFLSHCSMCHSGAGNPPGPNPVIRASKQLASENSLRALVRKPISSRMPPFSPEDLSDKDVHELYQYLSTQRVTTP